MPGKAAVSAASRVPRYDRENTIASLASCERRKSFVPQHLQRVAATRGLHTGVFVPGGILGTGGGGRYSSKSAATLSEGVHADKFRNGYVLFPAVEMLFSVTGRYGAGR